MRLLPLCLPFAAALAGCAALAPSLQSAADSARETAKAAAAGDDRTAAARIAAGISLAQGAVTLGCTLVHDAADVRLLRAVRTYCLARR